MPSPVAHIFYGQEYLKHHKVLNPGAFLRGTIFPDIRYLLKFDRWRTHRRGVRLEDVIREHNSWRAGWKFHNWLDEAWSGEFRQYGLDNHDHSFDPKFAALKLLEDEQLHRMLKPRAAEATAHLLMAADSEPSDFGVSTRDARHWSELVAELVESGDSRQMRERLLRAMNITAVQIRELEKHEQAVARAAEWPERVEAVREAMVSRIRE